MRRRLTRFSILIIMILLFIPSCSRPDAKIQETKVEETSISEEDEVSKYYDGVSKNLDNIYYNALDEINSNKSVTGNKSFLEMIYSAIYYTYDTISKVAPIVIVISWLLCAFIYAVAKRNKHIRRWAIVWLGIIVPVVLIIFIFGVGASPLFRAG